MPSVFLKTQRFLGFGGSINISIDTPIISAAIVLGREEIIDTEEFENTTFAYGGGSLSMGANIGGVKDWTKRLFSDSKFHWNPVNYSLSLYLLDVDNIEDPVTDYSGVFLSETTTAAAGPEFVWGEAYSPRDLDREKAHADMFGYTQGVALTKDLNVTGYVPVKTTSWFNPIPVFHDAGPALQNIWETIQSALNGG